MANMISISVGVGIAAYGEARFDTWGVFLQLGAVAFEATRLETSSFHFDFVIFGTNSLCAFALNLAVFLLVGKTSALTMNVAGVVKDWLLIAFSWSVIKDTVTPINLFGYGLAFLGVAYYNHAKLQALKAKEAQKKAQQADEEAGRLLEEREGEGNAKRTESED
ncbi:SOLUTE CARRIER FAMILY 35 [Salix koriyanagi]|uniref:SOLUTE CARRIER FAMILY 35 n=1 Tax=Salix koriyanagi TaxID=2511006 RepID=A0A9Q0ZSP4_9ROSI|nr:SOLUTE CARRIER FAMILY 35 [Salix koriyanagi]